MKKFLLLVSFICLCNCVVDDCVAIIQEGDAEGKNGEYDNKYVWIFKMKDGLIYSLREYNSDILVATQLYDYKLTPIDN